MKKTLVALAALAAAAGASAQVTISGYFGASYDIASIGNANAARTGNSSETRVSDQSSRIIFGVVEDLGGGLKAIGQYDMRFNLDAASRQQVESLASPTPNFTAGGNSHVGLTGDFGAIRLGRQDIYYVDTPSLLPGGLYLAANMSPVYHSLAAANLSRTPNLAWWVSPRINGFEGTVAYSTNPLRTSGTVEVENDLGTTNAQRKGSGYMLRLNYTNGPIDATLNTMDMKSDYIGGTANTGTGAGGAILNGNADQKGTNVVVKYAVNNQLKIAVGANNGQQSAFSAAGAPGSVTKANATSFSASYDMGAWNFAMHQANRGNQTVDGVEAASTGKSITSLAATYNFSKRTAAGLMYTTLKSDANTSTGLFYQSNNAYGGQLTNMNGETQNITSLALRHNF
jgi:predicted porin